MDTTYYAWQRNDGLVGVSESAAALGFGDIGFRSLGEFDTYNEAVDAALSAPGARRPSASLEKR